MGNALIKVSFDIEDSKLIREALMNHIINLEINNGSKDTIQKLQELVDQMPETLNGVNNNG